MAIIVSAPDAFFDAEPWGFDLSLRQPGRTALLDLTGSELYVAFQALDDDAPVGVCDTRDSGGSLVIANAPGGVGRFLLPSAGRIWRAPRRLPSSLLFKAGVVGDLYRLPPGPGGVWVGIARIRIDVLPSTGAPP